MGHAEAVLRVQGEVERVDGDVSGGVSVDLRRGGGVVMAEVVVVVVLLGRQEQTLEMRWRGGGIS